MAMGSATTRAITAIIVVPYITAAIPNCAGVPSGFHSKVVRNLKPAVFRAGEASMKRKIATRPRITRTLAAPAAARSLKTRSPVVRPGSIGRGSGKDRVGSIRRSTSCMAGSIRGRNGPSLAGK